MTTPVAFYAPLKPPDHPVASGDRRMARLLRDALGLAGFAPDLASSLRSFEGAGDSARQEALRDAGLAEADRLITHWRGLPAPQRPRLWFTYHVYYKAPDWIGPRVTEALAIPYVVAEGTRAAKRADGPWRLGHRGTEEALDAATVVFVMNPADRPALASARPDRQRLVALPPFIEATSPVAERTEPASGEPPRLLTVAMMRPGDKLASYRVLADALARLPDGTPWQLAIAGDGPARREVEALFARFGKRVTLHGLVSDPAVLAGLYAQADVFLWPAVNEAYGMVFLEAQAQGCPVVAGAYGGVADILRDGDTGLLASPGDADAFAAALTALLADPPRRRAMGRAAQAFVHRERSLDGAATILRDTLIPLVNTSEPPAALP